MIIEHQQERKELKGLLKEYVKNDDEEINPLLDQRIKELSEICGEIPPWWGL